MERVVSFYGAGTSAMKELSSLDTVLKETLRIFFQQSSEPSDSWNPFMLIFLASSLDLIFRIDADTATFLLLTIRSHLKMRSFKCTNVHSLDFLHCDLFLCIFIDAQIFSLFLIQVDSVFFRMP